jgi:DNA-binding MarR family transcriptional regulator
MSTETPAGHPGGGHPGAGHPGAGHPGGKHGGSHPGPAPSPRDRSSFRIALRIREITSVVNARIAEALASSGLTMPQITAIRLVAHAGSLTMTQICNEMNASPSTVAGIIDRLEAAGIVERKRSDQDRRVIHVSISSKGSDKALLARTTMETCFSKAFEALAEDELSSIEHGLDAVLAAFRNSEPKD